MRFRLLSKRYLPPAWFGKKGSRHSQQNVSNKFKDLAVVQIKSWNCGNGWHSYKRYQFFGAAEIGAVEPHESVYLYRTYGVLYHKSMQSPSPCSSPNYGPNLTQKGRFPRFESRKLMNCRQVRKKNSNYLDPVGCFEGKDLGPLQRGPSNPIQIIPAVDTPLFLSSVLLRLAFGNFTIFWFCVSFAVPWDSGPGSGWGTLGAKVFRAVFRVFGTLGVELQVWFSVWVSYQDPIDVWTGDCRYGDE